MDLQRILAVDLLIKSLSDTNRGVRAKAAASLLLGELQIDPEVQIKWVIPSVLSLLSDPSRKARHSVLFWLKWWAWRSPKSLVREAMPIDQICRAMLREKHPKNLKRFHLLIEMVLAAQEE